jgi:hypothetical protein
MSFDQELDTLRVYTGTLDGHGAAAMMRHTASGVAHGVPRPTRSITVNMHARWPLEVQFSSAVSSAIRWRSSDRSLAVQSSLFH